MQPMRIEYFECACHDNEHLLIINYDPDEGDLWVDVHLKSYPWHMRFWTAIKYIFGHKTQYGCFSTWMMNGDHVQRMIDLLNKKKAFDDNRKKENSKNGEKVEGNK